MPSPQNSKLERWLRLNRQPVEMYPVVSTRSSNNSPVMANANIASRAPTNRMSAWREKASSQRHNRGVVSGKFDATTLPPRAGLGCWRAKFAGAVNAFPRSRVTAQRARLDGFVMSQFLLAPLQVSRELISSCRSALLLRQRRGRFWPDRENKRHKPDPLFRYLCRATPLEPSDFVQWINDDLTRELI
jgi:hypothetical protein